MISPVTRLSHVALRSPDVGRLRTPYADAIGLSAYEEGGGDGTVYLASGSRGPTLELRPGSGPALDQVGFELAAERDDEPLARLADHGIAVHTASDPEPGFAHVHQIADVKGHTIQLGIVDDTRPAAERAPTGIVPNKLGHISACTTDAAAVVDFYESALGFRWSDWMGDFFAFLRCNTDHHTVNVVNTARPGQMHHFAFELTDAGHVITACDAFFRHDIRLIWGPGRHGIGHNLFTYQADPSGNVVELFCDLDRVANEELGYFEPRPWHEDNPQRPKRWVPDPSMANQWGPGAPPEFLA
jgi:catechol 2,3-dioxygenase-like lactoylglutathione lyase family enzyme